MDNFNLPIVDLAHSEAFYRAAQPPLGQGFLMRDGAAASFASRPGFSV